MQVKALSQNVSNQRLKMDLLLTFQHTCAKSSLKVNQQSV